MTTADNPFEAAKQRLLDDGWTKGDEAADTGERCVRGAIKGTRRVTLVPADGVWLPVIEYEHDAGTVERNAWVVFAQDLLPAIYGHSLAEFNDRDECTFDDVMDFLDVCARAWKERERDTTERGA